MKCTYFCTLTALGAWLLFVPADFSAAQTSSGSTGATTGVGGGVGGANAGVSGGGVGGANAGVSGGGIGGAFGGVTGGGVGGSFSGGANTPATNLNNAGAADRYRGQGVDFSRNETGGSIGTSNGNQFDRYNSGNNAMQMRDRARSRAEQFNDNDDFQSDPYQSRMSSRQPQRYDRQRDAIERRRYQEDRLLNSAGTGNFTGGYDDRYYGPNDALYGSQYNDNNFRNDNFGYRGRSYDTRNNGDVNVFVDRDYGNYGYVDGAYVDDNGNYIGRGVGRQYSPYRSESAVRRYDSVSRMRNPAADRMNTNDSTVRDRGVGNFDQLENSRERKQSMDRAANFADANLGREADERLELEYPEGTGTEAARRIDARVDPRAR